MGTEDQDGLGESLLSSRRGRNSESQSDAVTSTGRAEGPKSAAALRQESAITALWFAKGLLDSVPSVALRQFVLQELQASPASQAVIFSVSSNLLFPACSRPADYVHAL